MGKEKMIDFNNQKPLIKRNTKSFKTWDLEKAVTSYEEKKEVYFAFIDALGFKDSFDLYRNELFGSKEKVDVEMECFAGKYKDVFEKYFFIMDVMEKMEGFDMHCYVGQVSDTLYFYTDEVKYLLVYIKLFLLFNLYAMSKDVFFRGGIAKGGLYSKEQKKHQYFGESVIYSYLLEEKVADKPRILVDVNTKNDLVKECTLHEENVEDYLLEEDGRWRLNTILYCKNDIGEKTISFLENLEKELGIYQDEFVGNNVREEIKKHIKKNQNRFEFDSKNYSKFEYLKKQFNSVQERSE